MQKPPNGTTPFGGFCIGYLLSYAPFEMLYVITISLDRIRKMREFLPAVPVTL